MAAYRQFFRSPSYENQSYRCAAFLILAGQPTRAAAVLISRAAPEAVASAIIPGMLKTQWRLVSESPHVQLWERPSANKIVNFFGSLTDLDTHVPVERVSYTIAAAQGGTFVQST